MSVHFFTHARSKMVLKTALTMNFLRQKSIALIALRRAKKDRVARAEINKINVKILARPGHRAQLHNHMIQINLNPPLYIPPPPPPPPHIRARLKPLLAGRK